MAILAKHGNSLILVVVCVLGTLAGQCVLAQDDATQQDDAAETAKSDDYYELMRVFVDTFEQIDRNYVKDVDRRELMEAAIQGMIGKLDQYSTYIAPEDVSQFNQDVEKEFGGIGIQVQISPENQRLTVMTPLPGTPAYRAGVKAGDVIMEIEGESTEGYSIQDAVRLLKGPAGEDVTIGVRHMGSNDIEQIQITREVIKVATVLGDSYNPDGTWDYFLDGENKLAYIRLTSFSRRTGNELNDVLIELQEQGMQGLILDLRFNPGGLLSQATEVADLFIDQGKIVSTKGRNTRERVWRATRVGTFLEFPMAVLVNRYSASASEIVSACLQDHERAVVIGERTWGKGSVQNVIELEGGSSALKLTTASYHRPSGKNIHRFPGAKESDEWGVMPNDGYEVKSSLQDMQKYLDYRRDRDVIRSDGPGESDFEDKQLVKAVDYLKQELKKKADEADEKAEDADSESAAPAAPAARPELKVPVRRAA